MIDFSFRKDHFHNYQLEKPRKPISIGLRFTETMEF